MKQLDLSLQHEPLRRGKDYAYSRVEEILETGVKICAMCRVTKPLSDFGFSKSHPTGYKWECRKCSSVRYKKWRKKNHAAVKLKDRINHYIRKYGIPLEEAEKLVNDRRGCCEICQQEKKLVIDHCHASEKLRGKICSACNSVIGYAKESKETLMSAIRYLDKYGDA